MAFTPIVGRNEIDAPPSTGECPPGPQKSPQSSFASCSTELWKLPGSNYLPSGPRCLGHVAGSWRQYVCGLEQPEGLQADGRANWIFLMYCPFLLLFIRARMPGTAFGQAVFPPSMDVGFTVDELARANQDAPSRPSGFPGGKNGGAGHPCPGFEIGRYLHGLDRSDPAKPIDRMLRGRSRWLGSSCRVRALESRRPRRS